MVDQLRSAPGSSLSDMESVNPFLDEDESSSQLTLRWRTHQMRMDLLLQKAKNSFAESLQQSLKTIDPRLFKIAWTTLS